MRHRKKTIKLGRTAEHRKAMLANQVCSLIEHQRITTTLAKAKALRPLAEKMVTLGRKNTVHARRLAYATLRQDKAVKKLFDEVAPRTEGRNGGYTRIIKLGPRKSDSAAMAFIEWVDLIAPSAGVDTGESSAATRKEPSKKSAKPDPKPAAAAEATQPVEEPTEQVAEPSSPSSEVASGSPEASAAEPQEEPAAEKKADQEDSSSETKKES